LWAFIKFSIRGFENKYDCFVGGAKKSGYFKRGYLASLLLLLPKDNNFNDLRGVGVSVG